MPRQSKYWCFTINNPVASDHDTLTTLSQSTHIEYLVIGDEVGEDGTPHIQGFVIFNVRKRFVSAKTLIGDRSHVESTRGTPYQAAQYCKKDGTFQEYGDPPVNIASRNGATGHFTEYTTWCTSFFDTNHRPPSEREIAIQFPHLFIRYRNSIMDLTLHLCPVPNLQDDGPLRAWQRELAGDLDSDPDDRSIIFYVDPIGSQGKSWFQRWYYTQHPIQTQLMSVGKRDDLAHAIEESKNIFLFNVPRNGMEFLQYTILEQLKDKFVFSPKYNSKMKTFRKNNHVIVFCNESPDETKMSPDRYDIRILSVNHPHNIIN